MNWAIKRAVKASCEWKRVCSAKIKNYPFKKKSYFFWLFEIGFKKNHNQFYLKIGDNYGL